MFNSHNLLLTQASYVSKWQSLPPAVKIWDSFVFPDTSHPVHQPVVHSEFPDTPSLLRYHSWHASRLPTALGRLTSLLPFEHQAPIRTLHLMVPVEHSSCRYLCDCCFCFTLCWSWLSFPLTSGERPLPPPLPERAPPPSFWVPSTLFSTSLYYSEVKLSVNLLICLSVVSIVSILRIGA